MQKIKQDILILDIFFHFEILISHCLIQCEILVCLLQLEIQIEKSFELVKSKLFNKFSELLEFFDLF